MCVYPGCGRDVRLDVHHLDVDYATIDHIVPIAAGGLHTMANCQVMHRSCNSKKGDKNVGDPVQLKLI
jgi:5-methylcytosine-specific restriction endonuclease McrA